MHELLVSQVTCEGMMCVWLVPQITYKEMVNTVWLVSQVTCEGIVKLALA